MSDTSDALDAPGSDFYTGAFLGRPRRRDFRGLFDAAVEHLTGQHAPAPTYSPTPPGGGGSFSDWLSSLPGADQLGSGGAADLPGVPRQLQNSLVPALWLNFAPYGESLINDEYLARSRGLLEGGANARHEMERSLLSGYQAAGVDPLFAKANLGESRAGFGQQIAGGLADLEGNRYADLFNFQGGLTEVLANSYQAERDQRISMYLAEKGIQASRDAARDAQRSSFLQSGLGFGASLLTGGLF